MKAIIIILMMSFPAYGAGLRPIKGKLISYNDNSIKVEIAGKKVENILLKQLDPSQLQDLDKNLGRVKTFWVGAKK